MSIPQADGGDFPTVKFVERGRSTGIHWQWNRAHVVPRVGDGLLAPTPIHEGGGEALIPCVVRQVVWHSPLEVSCRVDRDL